jgi:single-strand selective monofunctional uracil DNA glycosylase
LGVEIGRIPHPSPASPAANRGWAEQAERALADLGIRL